MQLALLGSAPSNLACSRTACCLRLLHAYRRMHPPDATIRAARLSPPRLQAARHLKQSSLPSSRLLCLPHSGAASLPAVPERPHPTKSALGPISSEPTVLVLRRLRRRLKPAQTVPVCLWCPTSRAPMHACRRVFPLRVHCIDFAVVAAPRRRPKYLMQNSNRLWQLARSDPGRPEGWPLNRPTTRPCSQL